MIKRLFDVIISSIMVIVFLPVMVLVAFIITVNMGRPVLFRQIRPGLNGKPFVLIKFRTMQVNNDPEQPDSERLTSFGSFLRKTSLDELPELWNVLNGEMSLIGPRPLLMEYLPLYSKEQMCRHNVRPGITGWAQVNGRNALSWEKKFKLDLWYVKNQSLWLDCKILLITMKKVLISEGVAAEGHVTVEKFKGNTS